jgi:hypothetical protein
MIGETMGFSPDVAGVNPDGSMPGSESEKSPDEKRASAIADLQIGLKVAGVEKSDTDLETEIKEAEGKIADGGGEQTLSWEGQSITVKGEGSYEVQTGREEGGENV